MATANPILKDILADSQKTKVLTRRVLWKLDLHVLPPLALVSTFCLRNNYLRD